MGNEKLIHNTELQDEQLKDETETFNSFINVMVQIVEKYGNGDVGFSKFHFQLSWTQWTKYKEYFSVYERSRDYTFFG